MKGSQHTKDSIFSRRVFILGGIKLLTFGMLAARYFNLQVKKYNKFDTLSVKNYARDIFVPSERGMIFDRNLEPIVKSSTSYNLELNSAFISQIEQIYSDVKNLLKRRDYRIDLDQIIKKYEKNKLNIVLFQNLTFEEMVKILVNIDLMGKVEIQGAIKRIYLNKEQMCHLTGYIGKQTAERVDVSDAISSVNDNIGKAGIEQSFNKEIAGVPRVKRIEVDSKGYSVSCFDVQEGKKGNDIVTSIDSKIQKIVYNELVEHKGGAVVILDISGRVLSICSVPAYDPNIFCESLSYEKWKKVSSRSNILVNRAISSVYPPGSTFKIVTALSILNEGISPEDGVYCNGFYQVNGQKFHCWHKDGHGYVNLHKALAVSCNVYFYHYGSKVGVYNMSKIAETLGLGSQTNIELPFEVAGSLPLQKGISRKMRYGDGLNLAIGQGPIAVTPLQLAIMLARVVTGKVVNPTILNNLSIENPIMEGINSDHLNFVKKCMYSAVNESYGIGYSYRRLDNNHIYAGKTGSAQVVSKKNETNRRNLSHGLFIGFWPHERPKYIISVVIEEGMWGSKSALPVARNIMGAIT